MDYDNQGVRGLRKKIEGPGEMISAFWDEYRGFGLVLSEEKLAGIAVPAFRKTPGWDGSWGYDEYEKQLVDAMDCRDALYRDHQVMVEMENSSGHANSGRKLNAWNIRT